MNNWERNWKQNAETFLSGLRGEIDDGWGPLSAAVYKDLIRRVRDQLYDGEEVNSMDLDAVLAILAFVTSMVVSRSATPDRELDAIIDRMRGQIMAMTMHIRDKEMPVEEHQFRRGLHS